MNSPPRTVFSTISATSSARTLVYSQPSGSMRTRGPISQKPWQPDFLMPVASPPQLSLRETSKAAPCAAICFFSSSYTARFPPAAQPVPQQTSTLRFSQERALMNFS